MSKLSLGLAWYEDLPEEEGRKLYPFHHTFIALDATEDTIELDIGVATVLRSLSVYIVDNALGPILINAAVLVEGKLNQIDQPREIYDGTSFNAKRFNWSGLLPLSGRISNTLILNYANFSGSEITEVRILGVVEK